MRWFSRMFRKGAERPDEVSARSIRFDLPGWKLRSSAREVLEWQDAEGDFLRVCFAQTPFAFVDALAAPDTLRSHYRKEASARDGSIVAVEIKETANVPSVLVIYKFEQHPAYAYEGVLLLPFERFHFTITVRANEHGTTGVRDAVVSSHLLQRGELEVEFPWQREASGSEGQIKGWFRDPYDPDYQGPTLHSIADDDRLDQLFPAHPLTKVRRVLEEVRTGLEYDSTIKDTDYLQAAPSLLGESAGTGRPSESGAKARMLSSASLGTLLGQFGLYAQAEAVLTESIASSEKTHGADHPTVAARATDLMHVYLAQGKLAQAEGLAQRARYICEQTYGEEDPETAQSWLLLALVLDEQGRCDNAEPLLRKSLRVFETSCGAEHPLTAQVVNNLARVCISQEKDKEAEPLFRRALDLFNKTEQWPSSNAAVALNGLGLVHNQRQQYSEAIPFFEQALEIFEELQSPDVHTVLHNMALSHQRMGNTAKARRLLARSEAMKRKSGPLPQ